jgi:AcrR family transcriptional regulator
VSKGLVEARKKQRADSSLTREKILSISVRLFSENGFDGASMRAIADTAGVNLASMNYHFGSKVQLFEAAIQYAAAPINAERIRQLDTLEAAPGLPTVAQLVRAFVDVNIIGGDLAWPQLIARIFAEPSSLSKSQFERLFSPTVQRFLQALQRSLPDLDPAQLGLRFYFLVGAMLHLNRFSSPRMFTGPARPEDSKEQRIDELVNFAVAGLCQPPSKNNSRKGDRIG